MSARAIHSNRRTFIRAWTFRTVVRPPIYSLSLSLSLSHTHTHTLLRPVQSKNCSRAAICKCNAARLYCTVGAEFCGDCMQWVKEQIRLTGKYWHSTMLIFTLILVLVALLTSLHITCKRGSAEEPACSPPLETHVKHCIQSVGPFVCFFSVCSFGICKELLLLLLPFCLIAVCTHKFQWQ